MKQIILSIIFTLCCITNVNAGLISSDNYHLATINGGWTYGYTDLNAEQEYGTFYNDIEEYDTIDSLLSDDYEYSCWHWRCDSESGYVNGYNSLYSMSSGYLEFDFVSAVTLSSIEIITTRLYSNLSLEYFDGSTWNLLTSFSGGFFLGTGGSSNRPSQLMLDGINLSDDFDDIQVNGLRINALGENVSLSELKLFGAVSNVPEPALFFLSILSLVALTFVRKFR